MLRDKLVKVGVCLTLLFSLSGAAFSTSQASTYATEGFINKHMTNQNGTLATYRLPSTTADPNYALGRETLSESIGLWMEYLLVQGKQTEFNQQLQLLNRYYKDSTKHLLYWKLAADGTKNSATNALIDDLKVVEVLYRAHEKWGTTSYKQTADQIARGLAQYQKRQGIYSDYYDIVNGWVGNQVTLSYLNPYAFNKMVQYGIISKAEADRQLVVAKNAPSKNGFLPKRYIISQNAYRYDTRINMIDQSYAALQLSRHGVPKTELANWIEAEFLRYGKLYGQYDLNTKKPLVNYESPALYGITILYFLEVGKTDTAVKMYKRMIQFRENNASNTYYGGYVTLQNNDTHMFDNLFPLLAETELVNRNLI
ncbi:glycosyl hydrolase family 8 [Bacillus sp. CGMCC 1.16541]|uniref:glycosyl hydrolase family 8 n=1 Tax=Bacillus sp. CGMCC 1.16541 TaxID=2185143 RepID=UPI000D73D450|nr:glycosyl hydrolase family 8 [Bacillus sp. CGMCC 1.16541]